MSLQICSSLGSKTSLTYLSYLDKMCCDNCTTGKGGAIDVSQRHTSVLPAIINWAWTLGFHCLLCHCESSILQAGVDSIRS